MQKTPNNNSNVKEMLLDKDIYEPNMINIQVD